MALKPISRTKVNTPLKAGTRDATQSEDSTAPVWDRILFALLLLWTFLSLCFPMLDTDFWWHLKTGEWILEERSIPYVDLYTFVDSEKPWIDLHWGFQILITLVYHTGGVSLVTLFKAAIITAAVALAYKAGGDRLPTWVKSLLWLLPIMCITGRGNERPEMLSQLFLAIWLWIARHSDRRPGWIWYLPLVQLFWVNCHALFVLGLVVGFCYGIDAVIRDQLKERFGLESRTEGPELPIVWTVGLLVALTCFINPYFEEGALFPLTLYRKFSIEKDFYSQNIGEFQPPMDYVLRHGIGNAYVLAELGVWLVTLYSFAWLFMTKRRWSLFRLLMFAGFSHLAWVASRNINIFAIVSGMIACENFSDSRPLVTLPEKQKRASLSVPSGTTWTKWATAVVAFLCLLVVTGGWNRICEKNKPFGLGEKPDWFIHDAAKFAGQPGFPVRAFVANIGQAEVYVYHNGPLRKVFMDARLEVCTKQTFESFNMILTAMEVGDLRWQSYFKDEGLPVVILDSRTVRPALNGMLQTPGWRLVFADRSAGVFLPSGLADKLQLPPVNPEPLMYPDGRPKGK